MKRRFTCLLVALMALSAIIPVNANNQLTVFDNGDELSNTSPINLVYLDEQGTHDQVIYPAASLAEMTNEPINSMTFYITDEGLSVSGGLIRVSLAETTQTSFWSGYITEGLTQVATISLTEGVNELTIVFDTPFLYHGGNLLLDTYVEETTDESFSLFEGYRPDEYTSITRDGVSKFLPKTTFDYGTDADYAAKIVPTELAFNTVRAEREDVQTVTLKNVGKLPFTPTFSVNAPFYVDLQADPLPAGQSLEISVRFAPVEPGDYNSVLNIDCGMAGVLPVPLTGKAIQAAQDYVVCDSTDYASYVPIYGLDIDVVGTESQMIYPGEMLRAMLGHQIFELKFHTYQNVEMRGGTIQLSLKEIKNSAFSSAVLETELTAVATASPVYGSTELVFEFDEPFDYHGGNLLLDCKVIEPGVTNYRQTFFWGTPMEYNCGICKTLWYGSTFDIDLVPFLPLVTFSYSKDSEEPQGLRGDVNNDGIVNISDVTALIDYLLSGDASAVNIANANVNLDEDINISDVTALIDFLLSGIW